MGFHKSNKNNGVMANIMAGEVAIELGAGLTGGNELREHSGTHRALISFSAL